jgi:hypothetical protein
MTSIPPEGRGVHGTEQILHALLPTVSPGESLSAFLSSGLIPSGYEMPRILSVGRQEWRGFEPYPEPGTGALLCIAGTFVMRAAAIHWDLAMPGFARRAKASSSD